ncbi:MAG: carbohydrate kinase family protein [Actinobacteria bacterium]|nr:carbohydrate kinase family protein [Actinomycetota bacterium]
MSDKLIGLSSSFYVAGNLLTDLVLRGVEQMPAWGEEVAGSGHAFVPSGQATYLAQALRALGDETRVIGVVAADPPGERILAALRDCGADATAVEVVEGQTAISVAVVRPDGERCFISDFASLESFDASFLERALAAADGTICLVGLLNLPGLDLIETRRLLAAARVRGARVVLDTGWDPGGWAPTTVAAILGLLAEVDLFLPNRDEGRALTGHPAPEEMVRALAERCAGDVVLKLGPAGCLGYRAGEPVEARGFAVEVADTVGAGDCFNAGLLHALARGDRLEVAMRWANATSSIYVSRTQDRHPDVEQVAAFLESNRDKHPNMEDPR